MAYTDVKVTKVTSGNNYDISTHFTSGYTNTPSPYGTITITPKDGFTVENPLPVKVWVSYKSDGTDCGTKYFDFTIPGSGGGGGGSIGVEPASWPWDYNKSGSANKKVFTITKDNNVHIESIGLSGRDDNKFQLGETTGQTSFEVYPKANNTGTTDFEALVIVSYTVDGGSGRVINVQLTQFKESSPGPTPPPGTFTVDPTSLSWKWKDATNQSVTYMLGDGVSLTTVYITGTSENEFDEPIISYDDNKVYVKPKGVNETTGVFNADLVFTYTVNGGSQTTTVPLTQGYDSGCVGGELTVSTGSLVWLDGDVSEKTVTYTKGSGVSVDSINLGDSSENSDFMIVGQQSDSVTVKPRHAITSNEVIKDYLYFAYTANDCYQQIETVNLVQTKSNLDYVVINPMSKIWEHDELSTQEFVYVIGGSYSLVKVEIDGPQESGFTITHDDYDEVTKTGVVTVKPKRLHISQYPESAYLRVYYFNGSNTTYVPAKLEQKPSTNWIAFNPPTVSSWYADEYGLSSAKRVDIAHGPQVINLSIAFRDLSDADKFNLITGETSFSVYPLTSNVGGASNKTGCVKVRYQDISGGNPINPVDSEDGRVFIDEYFDLIQEKNSAPKPAGIKVTPSAWEWGNGKYGSENSKTFTVEINGTTTVVNSIDFTVGYDENKFQLSVASDKSSFTVYPKGANTTTGTFMAEVKVFYSIDGSPQTPKRVALYQSKKNDTCDGHECVDLGLPSRLKWATMNVGANSVTECGLYFQWGGTQGYTASQVGTDKTFDYPGCPYSINHAEFSKYNESDGKTVLEASDDAVHAAWGGNWRMPTADEVQELLDNTNHSLYDVIDGVEVLRFVSKTDSGKSIVIPLCGIAIRDSINDEVAGFWTSTIDTETMSTYDSRNAKSLHHSKRVPATVTRNTRYDGLTVRGVYYGGSPTPSTEHKVDLTYVNGSQYTYYYDENRWLTVDNVRSNTSESYENIKTAVVGDCVSRVADMAFSGCTELTNVEIPNSVEQISDSAFTSCVSLTSCTLGDGVRAIQEYGFAHCTGLSNITFPSSLVGIGKFGFTECSNIKSLNFPENFVELNEHAFYKCTKLESVDMSRSKTDYIGTSAFEGCSALTSVTMSNTLTEIFQSAFHTCIGLRSVTIPSTVTNIGNFAFLRCYHLERIICEPTTPPHLGGGPFPKDGEILCTIYVPDESYNDYINDESWSTYVNDNMVKKKSEMST